jgi:hypothetical protein
MITIALDSSQLSTYLKCNEKWNLSGRQHLRLSGAATGPLDNGTVFHKLLELYYIERFTSNVYDSAQEALTKFLASEEAKLVDEPTRLFLVSRFRDYIIFYSQSDFQPLRIDGIPSIELGFSSVFYEDNHRKFILEGKIDLLTSYREDLSFVDHKTQGHAMQIYPYTPQFLTYAMVTKSKKAVINIIRLHKEVTKDTFIRVPITFADHQIERWKQTVMKVFVEIYAVLIRAEATGQDPIFNQNQGECGGAFNSNPCPFTSLCEMNPDNKVMYNNIRSFKYHERIWRPWDINEVKELV